jgi:uncharacterized protein (UPF0548 family)
MALTMPLLRKPTSNAIQAFIASQAKLDFSYPAVGATAATPPDGYVVDRTRVRVGGGERAFDAGVAALCRWEHFRLGWVEAIPANDAIRPGTVVAVLARALGVWWLNACRITYVVEDRQGTARRWGFAYGTLPGHAESGEERFLIEWNRDDDAVHYDILAFSRPRHPLARLAYPLARRLQRRFARDSAAAMLRAVGRAGQ